MFIPDVDVTDDVVVNRHILAHDKSAITTKNIQNGTRRSSSSVASGQ